MAKKKTKKKAAKKVAKKTAKKTKKKAVKKVAKKPVKKAAKPLKKKTKTTKKPAKKKVAKKAVKKVAKKASKKVVKKPVKKTAPKVVKKKIAAPKAKSTPKPVKKKAKPAPKKVATLLIREVEDDHGQADGGDYYTTADLRFFKEILLDNKEKILEKARRAIESGNIALDKNEMTDEVDLASVTIEQNLQFRLFDRDRKLLAEIEHALKKIDSGDFGYCEGTGELIPKRRLELRPWTRHSVKYKEQLERMKKSGRGVGDDESDDASK